MVRLILLLALTASAASAQTAIMGAFDAYSAEYGAEPVAGPFVGQYSSDEKERSSTWMFSLEGGVAYVLLVHTAPGSDLDPDVGIFDSDHAEVAMGIEMGSSEMLRFTPEASGTYRVEAMVCCSDRSSVPVGAAVYIDSE